ncbi:ATP-binding protein [Protaetiibacter larvae]|uniref:AAA family ATPase n=1 Tax=Protaetiibacter larvae TaxID=2592654 RepID=A0A5C1Y533_9MICO|nr:BTAD domain-containing putative transcriptional regulator [Protaetiibacter larvae]QEO08871.1 AAA family ATPase [Protaetiibacter larvae]
MLALLGPAEVRMPGAPAVIPQAGRVAALLALLALEPGRVVSAQRLMGQLWEDDPPQSGVSTLYVYVSRLRRQLEPLGIRIATRPPGYALELDPEAIDVVAFQREITRAEHESRRQDWSAAMTAIDRARELWRGDPFAGLAACSDLRLEAQRLLRLHRRVDELEARVLLGLGDARRAAAMARVLTEAEPLDESYWELRMSAEHEAGNTAIALALFDEFRELLADSLGIDPGPRVRELHTRLLRDPVRASAGEAPEPSATTVGRTAQRAAVDRAIRDAGAGRGRIVVFEGAAGIGKTHLARFAAERAAGLGLRVAWARSADGAGAPPLWMWTRVLAALEPELADPLAELRGGRDVELRDDHARFALSEEIVGRVLATAARGPVLLVLDDIQWADAASLHALRLLASSIREAACAVVVTARHPESARAEVAATLAALGRESEASRHLLTPFSPAEVAELVRAYSREPLEPGALRDRVERLVERTGGNAFFLTSLLAGEEDGPLPASVAELLAQRIALLPEEAQRLLELAAVGGLALQPRVLAHALACTAHEVADALEAAARFGVVRADADGWAFSHSLARDAVLGSLPRSRRALLHARYADALAALHAGDPEAAIEELAHHRVEAALGVPSSDAFAACMVAADRARASLAYDRAARFRADALLMLDPDATPRERVEVLVLLTEEQRSAGDVQGAASTLRRVLRTAQALGDRETTVRALALLGSITLWNWRQLGEVDRETIALFEPLLAEGAVLPLGQRIELHAALSLELYYGDAAERERGVVEADRAVSLAGATGDSALLARALGAQVFSRWRPGRDAERLASLDRWVALGGDGGSAPGEIVARLHRASVRLAAGDVDGWFEDSSRAGELIPRFGRMEFEAQYTGQLACAAMLGGRLDEAHELVERTYAILKRTSIWGGDWGRAVQQLTLARLENRVGEVVDEIVAKASEDAHRSLRWTAVLALAEVDATGEARSMQARWGLRQVPVLPYWGSDFERAQVAEVAVRLGTPLLTEAYEALADSRAALITGGTALACWGPRDALLARLAARLGWDDAAAHHAAAATRLTADVAAQLGAAPRW